MPRLALYGAAGAVALSLVSAIGFQTWRLENAQEDLGRVQEREHLCRDANEQNQATITDLQARLDEAVRAREAHQERMNEAVRAARREAEAAASERDTALAELEALYAGDCQEWADLMVCPAVADRLRD